MSKNSNMKEKSPTVRFSQFTELWFSVPLSELSPSGFANGVFNDPEKVGSGYRLINVKDMYSGSSIHIEKLTRVQITQKNLKKTKP